MNSMGNAFSLNKTVEMSTIKRASFAQYIASSIFHCFKHHGNNHELITHMMTLGWAIEGGYLQPVVT